MNSAWVKLGFLAAGVALGVAAVKLLECDKVIVIREDTVAKMKDTAGQAVNAVKNTAGQIKDAVVDKFSKQDCCSVTFDCGCEPEEDAAQTEPSEETEE